MPTGGLHYPRSEREMRSWFRDDDACMDYLDWLRWGDARACSNCGSVARARAVHGRVWRCSNCTARVSRTAGTIFQDTRTPLTVWFAAAWEMCADKGGVSALALQRRLDLGSYQTAWTMLHRYRVAMTLSGRDLLRGRVEVDETFLGGPRQGPPGRGALNKTILGVAVELLDTRGFGRVRLRVLPDARRETLRLFLTDTVEAGATVVTDGWRPYVGATAGTWAHEQHPIRGSGLQAHELLPAVHRVSSLLKRWLLATHQGSVGADHLELYLAEFTFRFNRRSSNERGLLFYRLLSNAVAANPITYAELVVNERPKGNPPQPPPAAQRRRPRSLALLPDGRPWRDVSPDP